AKKSIDTSTPGGRLFFHIIASIAEFERDLISERTLDGLDAARARGGNGRGSRVRTWHPIERSDPCASTFPDHEQHTREDRRTAVPT
ncbi:MAG: recombinase family protein, partial [Pseudonocardiaceae bacterium]